MTNRLVLTLLVALSAFAAVAVRPPSGAQAQTYGESTVTILDGAVTPEVLRTWSGWRVTWKNDSSQPQRLVTDAAAPVAFDTGVIEPGATASVVLSKAGQYLYRSTTDIGVVGVILLEKDGVDRGRIEVTKVVIKGANDFTPQAFEICVQGPSYPTGIEPGACQILPVTGGVLAWEDVLAGEYSVFEVDPGSQWAVEVSPSTITVAPRETTTATVTNSTGGLSVTKAVDWAGSTPFVGVTFTVCITGPSYPSTSTAGACQQVSDGDTATWPRLAAGTYAVSEEPAPGFVTVVAPATVDVVAGQIVPATVTNTRAGDPGALEVTKKVLWGGTLVDSSKTFEVCAVGPSFPTGTELGACHTFGASGGQYIWEDLIAGSYTVVETDPGSAWDVSIEPATVEIDGNETVWVTVTNMNRTPAPPDTGSGLDLSAPATQGALVLLAGLIVFAVSTSGGGVVRAAGRRASEAAVERRDTARAVAYATAGMVTIGLVLVVWSVLGLG